MTGFSKLLDRDVILARIVPCVQALSSDSSQHVRASLAQQISGLAPLLGKESTIDVLVPLYLALLKDDFSEVRLNLISKLEVVNNGKLELLHTSGEAKLQSLVLTDYPRLSYPP
jgi:serine/threonine-protein phosphatase 2A regulatory subunit A